MCIIKTNIKYFALGNIIAIAYNYSNAAANDIPQQYIIALIKLYNIVLYIYIKGNRVKLCLI
jgi:hypothetical protein